MYLGIDVGATKSLFAVFDQTGKLGYEHKIATPSDYEQFKSQVAKVLRSDLANFKFEAACAALPAWFDFKNNIAVAFGNLAWQNVHAKTDLEELLPGVNILVHNDAKLAGLSEAKLIESQYRKVLYLTVSTGIGGAVIIDGVIDPDFANFEPGQMAIEHSGQTQKWESLASGSTLKSRYGKLASEIEDPAIWQEYSKLLAAGLESLLATIQPEVVVIGGGVGAHFEKFKAFLEADIRSIKTPLVPLPPLLKAVRAEEAVIYGCYDYIKQNQNV